MGTESLKKAGVVATCVLMAWLLIQFFPRTKPPQQGDSTSPTPLPNKMTDANRDRYADNSPAHPPPTEPAPTPSITPADRQMTFDAIDNLEFTFRDYANALGGNPVGTNREITAALLGDNINQLRLDIPGGSSINLNGELCDPWGTPWFFHQLSARKMEIRSAGPDRALYSEDDLVR